MKAALSIGWGVIAAIASIPVASALYSVTALLWLGGEVSEIAAAAISGIVVGLFGMIPATLLILGYGLPAFLVLRHFGLVSPWTLIAAAILPWVPIMGADPALLWVGWHSIVAAMTFWTVVRRLPPAGNKDV
ncbi:hypothetical protein [Panacagrimonas sp.]|uniref:hypothetical protein n=1 Tax=Panacagrimonas sp. TaxID=2480088 RepID=UPI003B51D737